MKPASFEYIVPKTLKDAVVALNCYADEYTKLLSGGQSLIPMMNMRLATPNYLVDLNNIEELARIEDKGDKIAIGALVRHSAIERSELIKEKVPLMPKAARFIGHFQIRNRGTIGGSIAHADPTAEWPVVLAALDATIEVTGVDGVKEYQPEDFFLTYLTTCLEPTDIVTRIIVPTVSGRTGCAFTELSRRHGDFAIVAVACQITLGDKDVVEDVRIALAGVNDVPYRARNAEDMLRNNKIDDELIQQAIETIKEEIMPEGDIHATAEYKREMAGVFAAKAIKEALQSI